MRVQVQAIGYDTAHTVDVNSPNLTNLVLSINGGDNLSVKGVKQAMLDLDEIRRGLLPFTRNGYKFSRVDESAVSTVTHW